MSKVWKYSVLFYSGEEGYLNNRVQITVSDAEGNTTGFIRFKDPDMPYDLDTDDNGIITMHLPSAMFASVLDALRNEKTDLYYQIGKAWLITGVDRAGHGIP
jgi:hypothetical protein